MSANENISANVPAYEVGLSYTMTRTASDEYVHATADWSGDYNKAHMDDEFAANGIFGQRIAHGLVCLGMISNLLGNNLPGLILMSQTVNYLAPVYIGEEITAEVKLTEYIAERRNGIFEYSCKKADGTEVVNGVIKCKMPKKA